ncbi:MAG: glycosyltransferase family 4 protein [Staphylococcus equorum]|nr:glycosyltransferase family 4 protein [Staphylococcus equorum]
MKILYIATVSGTINTFLIPHIQMLTDLGHTVDIACKISRPIKSKLLECGCKIFEMEFSRSPINKGNYNAYRKLKHIIRNESYDLIHTHTPIASTLARLACKNAKNIKVCYTAHGFHFYKGAPLKNWLIYYPIERWLARYTDLLITINNEDYLRAKKSFKAGNIEYVHGVGLDTKRFGEVVINKIEKRKELGIPANSFVLLSVGELNKNKNHETVLRAVAKLNNPNLYYVICGRGICKNYLEDLSRKLGIYNQVKLLGSRSDIAEICKTADIFVFPSFREGLSVALMEAMASGLPVVCSNIRGNKDLIENEKGGYLVKSDDFDEYASAIEKLINNYDIRISFGKYNVCKVEMFSIVNVIKEMMKIYNQFINLI